MANHPTSLSERIARTAKRLLGISVLAAFFGGGILTAAADSPVFNNNAQDYPTLQVARPGQPWATSTNAAPGETVNLLVWVHNNIPGTTATNTTVKVAIPNTLGTTHTPTATVDADNASPVTGSSTISVGTESRVTYIPGSAKLYKNVNGTLTEVSWPTGTNRDSVVTTGVNLGDVEGCWQFAQAVYLTVRIEGTNPAINASKAVAMTGAGPWGESVDARPSDLVAFRLHLENTGNGTGLNPRLVDTLDSRLTYVSGSSYLYTKVNNQDVVTNIPESQIGKSGQTLTWTFPDMTPFPSSALYVVFQAKLAGNDVFPVGTTTLQNCALASFTGLQVTTNCVTVKVTREITPVVSFHIRKEVTNLTLGDSKWYDDQLGVARPGDDIAYQLIVTNTGNVTAQNVTVKDVLPAGIAFTGNVKWYDTAHPNGVAVAGDAIVKDGYIISSFVNGNENRIRFTFTAKITGDCAGQQTFVNTGKVFYQGNLMDEDDASLIISCERKLIIQKDVWNVSAGQYADDGGTVREGDVIRYRVNVINNGNVTAVRPLLRDALPNQVTYVRNSLAIDGVFVANQTVQDAFFAGGMVLTDLSPGLGKVITFDVKVVDCPPLGDLVLTNTATVSAEGVAAIADTARVTLRVQVPTL